MLTLAALHNVIYVAFYIKTFQDPLQCDTVTTVYSLWCRLIVRNLHLCLILQRFILQMTLSSTVPLFNLALKGKLFKEDSYFYHQSNMNTYKYLDNLVYGMSSSKIQERDRFKILFIPAPCVFSNMQRMLSCGCDQSYGGSRDSYWHSGWNIYRLIHWCAVCRWEECCQNQAEGQGVVQGTHICSHWAFFKEMEFARCHHCLL